SFKWKVPANTGTPADTAITITLERGAFNDTVQVQAHENGTTWLVAVDSGVGSPTLGKRDSIPVRVQQQAANVSVTPFSDTLLVGQTTTFRAAAFDVGSETGGIVISHNTGKAYVALQTDTVAVIDTATDAVLKRIHVPLATYYMGVDESRNRIYASSNSSAMIYVIDGLTDLVVDSI